MASRGEEAPRAAVLCFGCRGSQRSKRLKADQFHQQRASGGANMSPQPVFALIALAILTASAVLFKSESAHAINICVVRCSHQNDVEKQTCIENCERSLPCETPASSGAFAGANPYVACSGGAFVTTACPGPLGCLGAFPRSPIVNNGCPSSAPSPLSAYQFHSGGQGWQFYCRVNTCPTASPKPQTTANGCAVAVADCVPFTSANFSSVCANPGSAIPRSSRKRK